MNFRTDYEQKTKFTNASRIYYGNILFTSALEHYEFDKKYKHLNLWGVDPNEPHTHKDDMIRAELCIHIIDNYYVFKALENFSHVIIVERYFVAISSDSILKEQLLRR